MAWVLRLVEIGTEGEGSCADVVQINRPDGLVDIADLGLTLAKRSWCWRASSGRLSPRRLGTTPCGGRGASVAKAFAA